jgi:ankyrin repeat protein
MTFNDGDNDIETAPLVLAARYGHTDTVRRLLEINPKMLEDKNTNIINEALQVAICHQQEHVVSVLLERGANALASTKENWKNSLEFAAALGYDSILEKLFDSVRHRQNSEEYLVGALQAAAAGGHDRIISRMCGLGTFNQQQTGRKRIEVDATDWCPKIQLYLSPQQPEMRLQLKC